MTNRRIVAVDGLDGSGKSQFAAALAAACAAGGVAATVLHVDDFRRELDFAGLDADAEAALYYERYFDLAALDGKLASLRGAAATQSWRSWKASSRCASRRWPRRPRWWR